MTREQISELISETDSNYVEEAKTINRLYSPKKLFIMGLVATFTILSVGFTALVIVKELAAGGTHTITKGLFGETSVTTTIIGTNYGNIYEEIDGELFFTYDGSNQNITEYCSMEDYFAYENIDENGNGYIMVVGGVEGERGHCDFNLENWKIFAGTASYFSYEDDFTPAWNLKAEEYYYSLY